MKEKDLPIDRTRHADYTKKAKKCVLRLLHRWYDDPACIVGDRHPLAQAYGLVKKENGLLVSVKK